MGSSWVITLGKKGEICAKAKFQDKFTPGALLTFPLTYSLHSCLGKSLIYCTHDLYNLSLTLIDSFWVVC